MTDVGHTGEAVAAKYYQQRGWLLLNHNYRTRLGELDLILYKENTLVFAEVKTRTGAMLDRRRRGGRPEAEPPDFGGPAIPAAQPLPRCRHQL